MKLREIYREYRNDGRSRLQAGALTYFIMPAMGAIMLGSLAVGVGSLWIVSRLAGALPVPAPPTHHNPSPQNRP